MFDLVMFDLDGTLVETAPEIADAVNGLLREIGLPAASEQLVEGWIGHGTRELLARAYAHAADRDVEELRADGTIDALMERMAEHYRRHCGTRSRLYPEVAQSLEDLRACGVRLAVVTNKEGRFSLPVLQAHDILRFFDLVVAGDSLPAKKPDPLPLQHCLDTFVCRRERALFVGDSQFDVQAARAAGVAVWALPYGYNLGRPVAEQHPDRMIASIAEVAEAARRPCAA